MRVLDRRVAVEPPKEPLHFIQKSSSRDFDSQGYRLVQVYCKSMMNGLFLFDFFPTGRVYQLEDENGEMAINMNRLKAQTGKLDEVGYLYYT